MRAPHLPAPWVGASRLGAAIVLVAGLAGAGLVAGQVDPGTTEVAAGAAPDGGTADPEPAAATGPQAYIDLHGGTPATFPATRLGVASLVLDEPFGQAVVALGPPASSFPDIGGTASTWDLPGGARFTVGAWDDDGRISALYADVPPGSPVRVSAYGAVIGQSTLAEVVAAWGPGYRAATSPYDDYVVSWVECVGPSPVVVKFDQASATEEDYAPGPGSPLWTRPVTSVFVGFADERPGTAGCPAR